MICFVVVFPFDPPTAITRARIPDTSLIPARYAPASRFNAAIVSSTRISATSFACANATSGAGNSLLTRITAGQRAIVSALNLCASWFFPTIVTNNSFSPTLRESVATRPLNRRDPRVSHFPFTARRTSSISQGFTAVSSIDHALQERPLLLQHHQNGAWLSR